MEHNYRMPNEKKAGTTGHSDTDSGAKGSNHGATSTIKKAPAGGAPGNTGSTGPVTTTNRYPNGLA